MARLMSESALKANLRVLSEQAIQRVAADDRPLEYFAGATAMLDMRRDQAITELPGFEEARTALGSLPLVQEHYGAGDTPDGEHAWERLTLQFVYGFLAKLPEPTFDPATFEATWEAFWEELATPEWTWFCMANLRNFRSESNLIEIADGVTIRGRSFEELARMGWSAWHLGQLEREWYEGGVNSSHVILVEHKVPKTPDNFVGNEIVTQATAFRALLAMRLLKQGDIGLGRLWFLRRDAFSLGLLGNYSTGFSGGFMPGSQYTLNEVESTSLRELYNNLVRYEGERDNAPVNLDLALAFFSNAFDHRGALVYYTRLVDNVTALEALLGTTVEISFRLSAKVAGILANDDDERVAIYNQVRDYYDTRSRVVHGEPLKAKYSQYLTDYETLQGLLRRLLVGFIRLTIPQVVHSVRRSSGRGSIIRSCTARGDQNSAWQ